MSIAFDYPVWLLLIVPGATLSVVGWRVLRGLPRSRRLLAVGARFLLIVALALSLAGVYRQKPIDRLTVVGVVDVSGSVIGLSQGQSENPKQGYDARTRQFFSNAITSDRHIKEDDQFGLIAFDGQVRTITSLTSTPRFDEPIEMADATGSALRQAIDFARSSISDDNNGRLVLISDGRLTDGDLDDIQSAIPIDVLPVEYDIEHEVIVERVETPSRALKESIVDIRTVLNAATRTQGQLRITYNNQIIDLNGAEPGTDQFIELDVGQNVITSSIPLSSSRVHQFEALFIPVPNGSDGVMDTDLQNNSSSAVTMTNGNGTVGVVVSALDSSTFPLTDVIGEVGWNYELLNASNFPTSMLELDAFDLLIFDNIARDELPMGSVAAIDSYTRELGGGVIFSGGDSALGAGNWQSSEIEPIIPVQLQPDDELFIPSVAVVLVLDSSGSMKRSVMGSSKSQQRIANDAAAGALQVLDPKDLVGVVSFSDSVRTVYPLRANSDPESIERQIKTIRSGGGTYIVPALQRALELLEPVSAQSKHIVLLSDGESENAELLPELAEKIGEQGVRISTISVGDEADDDTMRAIASNSQGYSYRVLNPTLLPRVFLKAIRYVRKPMIREGSIGVVVTDPEAPMLQGIRSLPNLQGIVLSQRITEDPQVQTPIVTDDNEPVLAYLQAELGRVAVFTSDLQSWTRSWKQSGDLHVIWQQLVQWAARSDSNDPGELKVRVENEIAYIEYESIDQIGKPIDHLQVDVQILDSSGNERTVSLVQDGPGTYEAQVRGLPQGVYVLIAQPRIPENYLSIQSSYKQQTFVPTIAGVQLQGAHEFEHLSADRDGLVKLANRTGGRVLDWDSPTLASLFDRSGMPQQYSLSLYSTMLLLIAFVLFMAELISRRLAFDRWIAQARADTIAVTQRQSQTVMRDRADVMQSTRAKIKNRSVEELEIDRSPMKPAQDAQSDAQSVESKKTEPSQQEDEELSLLLKAKKRAREQFDQNS